MGVEQIGLRADQADRLEVLLRVVAEVLVEADVDRERGAGREQDGVAVGRGRATAVAAMPPPAPARFSTTTGCLRISSIFLVRMRAITSLGPPGAKPMIKVIGLLGNCAAAGGTASDDTMTADNKPARSQPTRFIASSQCRSPEPTALFCGALSCA